MAHIQRRKTARGYSYKVRYIDPDGRERSRTFTKKAHADDFAASVDHSIRAGAYVDPSAGRITVQQYLENWLAEQAHHRANTTASVAGSFRNMVYPLIGHMPLARVKPSTVRAWQKQLTEREWKPGRTYANSSIRSCRSMLSTAFSDAVRDKVIAASPFDGVRHLEPPSKTVVPRTVAQVRAAEQAMRPTRYRAAITLAAGSGMRYSEIFGLTVDRIDFLRRTVRVDRQLVGRAGPAPIFGPVKTPSSNRTIPLASTTIAALAAHLAQHPAGPTGLVFTTSLGTPVYRGTFSKQWIASGVGEALGLQPGEGIHHLRHFYASLLIAAGRSVKEVQERLGHGTAQETLNTYSHLWEGNEDGTRDAIERALGNDEGDATHLGDAASSSD